MTRIAKFGAVAVCTLAVAVGCNKKASNPSAPSASDQAITEANADGSTLKATVPTLVSPINGVKLNPQERVVLVAGNATTPYLAVPLTYRFELTNAAGAIVESVVVPSGTGTTSRAVTADLENEAAYQWRVRAEYQQTAGPWSARAAFVSPVSEGYVRGSEIYDPLINGKTVGTVVGPVTFIPGVGVRLESLQSYIVYELPSRIEDGEMSALITGLETNTEGGKTKVFSMGSGFGDVTANNARMTVEKRGDAPPGAIAWRFVSTGSQIDTEGGERVVRNFSPDRTYFWSAEWRNSEFRLIINDGGVAGPNMYNFGKRYKGFYNANPHVAYIGAPPTRGGPGTQSVQGMIVRQLWVSDRPRPTFANK